VLDIVGHTCPLGNDGYNDKLGLRRAESVAAYLMRRGIAPTRLRSTSAGERRLVEAAANPVTACGSGQRRREPVS
jgi:peptidoglycan-associated lipoprotein